MAWTTPGTAVAGDVLTAAFWNTNVRDNSNALSRGIVAKTQRTTATASTTAEIDAGLSVTWTAESDRIYLIVFHGYLQKTTNAGWITVKITDASNNVKQLGDFSLGINAYNRGVVEIYETGLSGSITRKVRFLASNTDASIQAAATYPAQLYVIDMGLS
jgi:hypothetical protein